MTLTNKTSLYFPFDTAIIAIQELHMPQGFDTTPRATECNTLQKISDRYIDTGRVLVWDGASSTSIFKDHAVNLAFRAWHDLVHIEEQYPFTLQGEIDVCRVQQSQLKELLGYTNNVSRLCCRLLEIEIIEQVKHYLNTGEYVKDQRQFTIDKLLAY